ncbi:MAG: hypothetical protein MZV64_17250 [Ignavibacteriales bacterium]|nr:hypothetical protein [Ignavibacteriales bacterium]
MKSASSWSCVTNTTVACMDFRIPRTCSRTSVRKSASRLLNGSSINRRTRTRCQCPRQRHALTFTARQRVRIPFRQRQQPDEVKHLPDGGSDFIRLPAPQPKGDVFENGQDGKQGVVLEHHPHAALFRRDKNRVGGNDAVVQADKPRIGSFEPRDEAQGGRLAASARTDKGEDLVLTQFKGNIVHGRAFRAVKSLDKISHFQGCHLKICSLRRRNDNGKAETITSSSAAGAAC